MEPETPDLADRRPARPDHPDHPGRWLRRWWPLVLTLVLAPVVALAVGAAVVVAVFSGGVDELFRGDPPRQGDPEVVAARQEAAADLADELDAVGALARSVPSGSPVRLGGGLVDPGCRQGQHNWKIDDDYDLLCRLERVELFAVPGAARFRADMEALDEALRDAGWRSTTHSPLDRVLDDYWAGLPAASPEPGTRPSGRVGHGVGDLPPARYIRTAGSWTYGLEVDWAERGSPDHTLTVREEQADLRDARGRRVRSRDLLREIPAQGYAVVLTGSVEYFRG